MQGIILAAGMGSRLKNLTQKKPKCMVEVSGVTLIERALKQLDIVAPLVFVPCGYPAEARAQEDRVGVNRVHYIV